MWEIDFYQPKYLSNGTEFSILSIKPPMLGYLFMYGTISERGVHESKNQVKYREPLSGGSK